MSDYDAPEPNGSDARGPTYSGPELGAWRMAMGVQQEEVAERIGVSIGRVSHIERMDRAPERHVAPIIRAVVFRARTRDRMRLQGIVMLDAIRRQRQEGS